jgi:Domain of unknown function (DUF5753)/Helix-turn-helix domain
MSSVRLLAAVMETRRLARLIFMAAPQRSGSRVCYLDCRPLQNFHQYSRHDIWKNARWLSLPQARVSGTLFSCAASVTGVGDMALSGSPTVRRRRLAAELRRLRGKRTGGQVSRGIGWSPTKISRAESGHESIPPPEVEKLLDFYGVKDPLRSRLLELAEDATQRGWWEDYADAVNPPLLDFIGLEAEAVSSLQWQADAIPGLFQTEGYARQLGAGFQTVVPTTTPSSIDRFVQARMLRQERLTREPALEVSVVLDEAVLLRRVGDRELMRAQLERLTEVADLPNVDLRVMPLDRDIALLAGSFVIMSFGSRSTAEAASLADVVSTESLNTELYVEGETDTYLYRLFFQALVNASLSAADSLHLIVTTIERTWS